MLAVRKGIMMEDNNDGDNFTQRMFYPGYRCYYIQAITIYFKPMNRILPEFNRALTCDKVSSSRKGEAIRGPVC